MKQYIPTAQTLKAIESGARLMLVKIDEDVQSKMPDNIRPLEMFVFANMFLPLVEGDEIYIAEEVFISLSSGLGMYKRDIPIEHRAKFTGLWELCSEQQSRFKFKVGEVSVKRVNEVVPSLMQEIMNTHSNIMVKEDFEDWLKDQGINYKNNQYVALVELKDNK